MPLLDEQVREEVRREFAGLTGKVKLLVFTQEFECDYCAEARGLAEELSELSDRIEVEVHDLLGSKAVAERYGIDKIPAIVVLGEGDRDYGIRFFGVPAGYEFASLLEAIKLASSGDSGLSPEAREALRTLKNPVHIQVFVTLTCPYCPMAVQLAHRLAVESGLIRADMIEASEFPHLANRYGVYAVPKVVMNERVSFEGAVPEKAFVDYLLQAAT